MTRLKIVPKMDQPEPPPPPPGAPNAPPPPPPGDSNRPPGQYPGTHLTVQPGYGQQPYQYGQQPPPQYPYQQPQSGWAPQSPQPASMAEFLMIQDERRRQQEWDEKREREVKARQAQPVERAKPAAKDPAENPDPAKLLADAAATVKGQFDGLKALSDTMKPYIGPSTVEKILNSDTVKTAIGNITEGVGAYIKSQVSVAEYQAKADIDVKKEKQLLEVRGLLPASQTQAQAQPAQTGPGAPPAGSPQNPLIVPPNQGIQGQPGAGQPLQQSQQQQPWQPRPDIPLERQVEVRVPDEEMRAIKEHDQRMVTTQEMLRDLNKRLDRMEGLGGGDGSSQGGGPGTPPPAAPPGASPPSSPFGSAPSAAVRQPAPSSPPPSSQAAEGQQPTFEQALSQKVLIHRFECRIQPCNGKVYAFMAPTPLQAGTLYRNNHLKMAHPESLTTMIEEIQLLRARKQEGKISQDEEDSESLKVEAKYVGVLPAQMDMPTSPPQAPPATAASPTLATPPIQPAQQQVAPAASSSPSPTVQPGTPPPLASAAGQDLEANGGVAMQDTPVVGRRSFGPAPLGGESRAVFPIRCKKCPPTETPSKYIAMTWESAAEVWFEHHFTRKHPSDATALNRILLGMKGTAARETDPAKREIASITFLIEAARIQAEVSEFLPTEDLPKEEARPEQSVPASPEPPVADLHAPSESSPRQIDRGSAGAESDIPGPPGDERTDDSEGDEEAEEDGSSVSSVSDEDDESDENEEVGRQSESPGGRMKAARPEVKTTTQPLKPEGSTRRPYRRRKKLRKKGAKNKAEKTEKGLTKDEARESGGDKE